MKEDNSKQLLRNPEQEPDDALFKNILDERIYEILKKVEKTLIETGINLEWRYYRDGKAWLGKATYKKNTIVGISVWEKFVKAGFYLTEKTRLGALELSFNEEVKSSFASARPIGKLIPLSVEIKDEESLQDFAILLHYKKGLR